MRVETTDAHSGRILLVADQQMAVPGRHEGGFRWGSSAQFVKMVLTEDRISYGPDLGQQDSLGQMEVTEPEVSRTVTPLVGPSTDTEVNEVDLAARPVHYSVQPETWSVFEFLVSLEAQESLLGIDQDFLTLGRVTDHQILHPGHVLQSTGAALQGTVHARLADIGRWRCDVDDLDLGVVRPLAGHQGRVLGQQVQRVQVSRSIQDDGSVLSR